MEEYLKITDRLATYYEWSSSRACEPIIGNSYINWGCTFSIPINSRYDISIEYRINWPDWVAPEYPETIEDYIWKARSQH
jgi:hypothetical protein